ncbi:unnamed protein product [Malus baccata var. baccata]
MPILIDRILEAQMDDEETQEIIQARNRGKKKDFRIRETDGMLMQESRMYVPNNMELKKAILDEAHISAYAMHPGVQFGKKYKLSPRFIGPYMITKRVGEVAYRLELPLELSKVHDVFHVSMLHHFVSNPSHVIPPQPLEINSDLTYDEEPVTILDWKDKVLRNKTVRLVKVLWRNHLVEEATWETEDRMRDMYPRRARHVAPRGGASGRALAGETYPEDERHQSRLGGYAPSTYQ